VAKDEHSTPAHADACQPPVDGAPCNACGERLPQPAEATRTPDLAGVPFALMECPACGTRQVVSLGAPLCDGESLALRQALEYLARRAAEQPHAAEYASEPPR
jgi:hypothetical protein